MSAPHEAAPTGIATRLKQGWLLVAGHFGEVQTLILVTLIYAFGIGPMGTFSALLRRDPLKKRALYRDGSAWNPADTVTSPDLERAKRLF